MRVLFVGNSHTYFNDMPQTFAQLWEAAFDEAPAVTMLAYSNRSLQWHGKEYFALRFNLLYGGYDACVIQQSAHPFPGYEVTRQGIGTAVRLCRAAGVRPYLYMPWAEKRFPEHQPIMTGALRRIAAEEGLTPVPVGDVWQLVQRRRGDLELYWHDGEHASPLGDYLVAAVMCMVISGKTELPLPPEGRDFTGGADIDFDRPAAVEDAARTRCAVEPSVHAAILAAAREVLRAGE